MSARPYLIIFCFHRTKLHGKARPGGGKSSLNGAHTWPRAAWQILRVLALPLLLSTAAMAQVAVFWQPGFPTVASQPFDRDTLEAALKAADEDRSAQPIFLDLNALQAPGALKNARLLVLPYGSAVPVAAWHVIVAYRKQGGNLLVLGGQPFRVPVAWGSAGFEMAQPQDTYARATGLRHTYQVPVVSGARFVWKEGYSFPKIPQIRANKYFTVEGGLEGLGYMVDAAGLLVAAPVIVKDDPTTGGTAIGSRMVCLDFEPTAGYWASEDGLALIGQSAAYAMQGATHLSLEVKVSVLRPGEEPEIQVHLRQPPVAKAEVSLQIMSAGKIVASATLPANGDQVGFPPAEFRLPRPAGFYRVRATLREHGRFREAYENGFWVSERGAVDAGPALGVRGDFLTRGGQPFLPVGTNYFTTEENGWDFSGARNASVWDKDFAEMAEHGVTFVRTGVWNDRSSFIDSATGAPKERFLRNLEAYLLCAQHHGIAVNFTFFAFTPASGGARQGASSPVNPYLDEDALHAQKAYVRAVVQRFASVRWLCWDLINEPSFSNPRQIFKGNVPNGDAAEVSAWQVWLLSRYTTIGALADAWGEEPEDLGAFDKIPLPEPDLLTYARHGQTRDVRAIDYNLFAQDMFSRWVQSMALVIRQAGSQQLINVGQDEGGVTNRLLNQFYGRDTVAFTTNHTYWQDDALLWDSIAAKIPGVPNITGETGYQPAWEVNGAWRYDELTGLPLIERKWALGFAAGSSGAMQWDWAREVDFGMQRSDGSAKLWEPMMQRLGEFATAAAPYATAFIKPQIAIVLPQSLQLSVRNTLAVQAQQAAVRALYHYARGEAYAVGEYQIAALGSPRLIILPSPFGLTQDAWNAIIGRVRAGAVLLVTGPFGADAHLHATDRPQQIGLPYQQTPLTLRNQLFQWPGGKEAMVFAGNATTALSLAQLPGGKNWAEQSLGKGKILFASLPIELNQNLQAVGNVYQYAMKAAKVDPTYFTALHDEGILICPTRLPQATLYVLTSESNQTSVFFRDVRSGKDVAGQLQPGRAALLLIGAQGQLLASYNWHSSL